MGRSQWSKGMLNTVAMVKRIEMVGTVVTVPEPPALEKKHILHSEYVSIQDVLVFVT